MNKFLIFIALISFSLILKGCDEPSSNIDAEVHITNFYKWSRYNNRVYINYQVENVGEEPIRGWKIFFRISMKSGNQMEAYSGLTYPLDEDELSEELLAIGIFPDHFRSYDVPIKAVVKYTEVY